MPYNWTCDTCALKIEARTMRELGTLIAKHLTPVCLHLAVPTPQETT